MGQNMGGLCGTVLFYPIRVIANCGKRVISHPREVVRRLFISCVLFTVVSAIGLAIASGVKGAETWKPCAVKLLTVFCVGDVSLMLLGALISIWSARWPE